MRFFLLSCLLIVLWSSQVAAQTADRNGDGKVKIGALIKNESNPYFRAMREGYEFAAARYNVEIIIGSTATEDAADQQLAILESWLNEGDFDGFIVTPFRAVSLNSGLIVAAERGIPVINIDELIPADAQEGLQLVAQIASNNVRAGNLAGELVISRVPADSEVAIIEGAPGTTSSIDRVQGFHEAVTAAGLTVAASQPANWDRSEAFNVTTNILQGNPNIKAIFAANDGMGLGAVEAVDAAGLSEQVIVVSVDAIPEALDSVRAGKLVGTVAQYPDEMAILAVEAMLKVLQGRPVTPQIESPLVMITDENVETAGSRLSNPSVENVQIGVTTVQSWEIYTQAAAELGIEIGSENQKGMVIEDGVDTTISWNDVHALVTIDEVQAGIEAANYILSEVEAGSKVAVVGSNPTIIESFITAAEGLTVVTAPDVNTLFNEHSGFSVVFAVDDVAATAVGVMDMDSTADVVGIIPDPTETAYLALENLIKLSEGRPVVPVIKAPVMVITYEDLAE